MNQETSESETLIQITLPYACFGLISLRGRITYAAPIAGWTVGKSTDYVLDYYKRKGGTVWTKKLSETMR